jgi:hypothetical protein
MFRFQFLGGGGLHQLAGWALLLLLMMQRRRRSSSSRLRCRVHLLLARRQDCVEDAVAAGIDTMVVSSSLLLVPVRKPDTMFALFVKLATVDLNVCAERYAFYVCFHLTRSSCLWQEALMTIPCEFRFSSTSSVQACTRIRTRHSFHSAPTNPLHQAHRPRPRRVQQLRLRQGRLPHPARYELSAFLVWCCVRFVKNAWGQLAGTHSCNNRLRGSFLSSVFALPYCDASSPAAGIVYAGLGIEPAAPKDQ